MDQKEKMRLFHKLGIKSVPLKRVLAEVNAEWEKDQHFKDGRVMYSMCNSPPYFAKRIFTKFMQSNLGDANLYKGTGNLEKAVISMAKGLMHGDETVDGHVLAGGSETNITALWVARTITGKTEVLMPLSAHFSFRNACHILNMKAIPIRLNKRYQMDIKEAEGKITKKTAAIVAVAGTTELGVIDPIEELSQIAVDKGVFLHVDAAYGGFVFPFMKRLGHPVPEFDFSLPGVQSMALDPHKMGMCPAPAGVFLIKNSLDRIKIETIYLSIEWLRGILGTRASGSVAAAYAVMRHYGFERYTEIIDTCLTKVKYAENRIRQMGLTLALPDSPATVIVIEMDPTVRREVEDDLHQRGWFVSRTRYPSGLRLTIMPHISWKNLRRFLGDLESVVRKERLVQ